VPYREGMCEDCVANCCTLPVEARLGDLLRMGVVDAFEAGEPEKQIARRLMKEGVVEHFNHKHGKFTLTRLANGDCLYLDPSSRRCTIYDRRPDVCRHHPAIGPRPGYCAYHPR